MTYGLISGNWVYDPAAGFPICGSYMRRTVSETSENHSLNAYQDLGHQNDTTHKYKIYCGNCGGDGQEIYLNTCDWHITGQHTTPW